MITKRLVITNNEKAYKRYSKTAEVIYLENGTPHEVFLKAMKHLEEGARLSNPVIKDVFSYYRTVGLFYGDEKAPIARNLNIIKKAVHDTYDTTVKKPSFDSMSQLSDLRRCKMSV